MKFWPDKLLQARITYSPGDFSDYVLRDTEHGIPILGFIKATVCNYPGQTESVARRLVAAWNASVGVSTEELERIAEEKSND